VFNILSQLILGSTIRENYIQDSLFDIYDFSIIPVEFISNVYELFIGMEQQQQKGAYYTPVFLVDYMLSQTVKPYFETHPREYNCKILDPACGSGIFLVEAYRKIINRYQQLNPDKTKLSPFQLKKLAQDNLFGIDKDPDAISVAAFSLYLTMLDYQSPADIEQFKFPRLIEKNLFEGDFFDPNMNNKFNNIKFIIGNPPWKRGMGKLQKHYIDERKKKEQSEIAISNHEIAQAFLLRISDFSCNDTECALIVTSKILYNLNGQKFRKYFLDNYFINKVFELAAVRREIFERSNDPAIAPAAMIFYRYGHGNNTDSHIIEHIALKPNKFFLIFKIFSIQRIDYKRVVQKRLKEYDYLWKILVYGNYLDFNFIKRLKDEYQSIINIMSHDKEFFWGQGIMVGGGDKNPIPYLKGIKFIDTTDIKQFFINPENDKKWEIDCVHRPRNKKLFVQAPILLVTEGVNKKLESVSAISYQSCVFKSSLTGIISTQIDILRNINALLNSKFFSFYILQTGSSAAIEREQTHDEEKWKIPFFYNKKIINLVTNIEKLKQSYYREKTIYPPKRDKLQMQIDEMIKAIDEEVLNSFDLSDEERSLIDYGVDITIPMIMRSNEKNIFSPIESNSPMLKAYIEVFLKRFEPIFNRIGMELTVEVWHNNNVIGIFFNEKPKINGINEKITLKKDLQTDYFLKKVSSLGIKKITSRLFIQKDIRGFEMDGFYIIKPNEKRLWHKAIAYLDMYEFADAILKAGREESHV